MVMKIRRKKNEEIYSSVGMYVVCCICFDSILKIKSKRKQNWNMFYREKRQDTTIT